MSTIVLANNYYFRRGGAEAVLMQQENMLQAMGFKTALMATAHHSNQLSEWSEYFAAELEWDAGQSWPAQLRKVPQVIFSRQAYRNTRRLIADTGADLLHAHNVYHHLSPSVLKAATDAGIPSVLTVHDYKLLCPAYSLLSAGKICEACKGGKLHNAVLKRCMKESVAASALVAGESAAHRLTGAYRKHVDRFLSPSHFVIEKFVEWGWPRDRFDYVPNCVDCDQFVMAERAGDRLLYVGRLAEEKGVATLIEAAARAKVALDIVGTGPLAQELQARAVRLNSDVVFHGYQAGENLWAHIRDCRALVLPSQWYENAPISVLEAFAIGKPVIVANIGGMPEMVAHEQTGLIFDFGQIDSLTQALTTMQATSAAQLMQMGRAAREVVERDFSPGRQASLLLQAYERLGVSAPERDAHQHRQETIH